MQPAVPPIHHFGYGFAEVLMAVNVSVVMAPEEDSLIYFPK
jgi:hypothetical protein